MKIKENLLKLKNILLLIGIVFITIGGILTLNFNYDKSPAHEFDIPLYAIDHPIYDFLPVRIDSTFYLPKNEYNWYLWTKNRMPAIVFVHGYSADKTFFRGLAHEFVRRGFFCISITARGHGASGGVVGLTWENETLTAVDYLEWLAKFFEGNFIDMDRIGLIGHSMGAFSVTLAASADPRINATVAIGGPLVNITRGFGFAGILSLWGPENNTDLVHLMNYFDLRTITCLMPGLNYYMQYPVWMKWALENAVIEGKVNKTNPSNYLNIIGSVDEAFSVYSAQEVLWHMGLKGNPYNITHYVKVLRNHLYGEFNGTARKLTVLPTTDHLIEHFHPACIYETLNWMEKSMNLTHPIYGATEYWIYQILFRDAFAEQLRSSSPIFMSVGLIIAFIPVSVYLGNWLKSKFTNAMQAKELEKKKMWLMFLIYGIAFSLISLITMPVIQALNIVPWTDYLGFNMLHMLLFVQAILFLPVLIALIIYERWKFKESWEDFGIHPKAFLKSALYGILLALFIFLIVNLGTTPTLYNALPTRPCNFMEIFLYMLVVFTVSEILFRGLIQTKLSRYENVKLKYVSKYLPAWKEFLLSSLVTAIIQGIGVGIVASMFINSLSLIPLETSTLNLILIGNMPSNLTIPNVPLPLLIISGCIGLFFLLSLVMNWLYRKSRNVMGLIIFSAFIISWISVVITPAISGSII
ncbi:MAG: alpha/beta hydrolase family protein [Candidatus Hodarchaeota archaeon]